MLNIQMECGAGGMSEDAFGTLPVRTDKSKPTWHLPPGLTIPFDRRALNEPNAWFLMSHPSLSIRTQAKDFLDGIEALQKPYTPDEYEMGMWFLELDESCRKEAENYLEQFNSSEDFFKQQQKG